MDDGIHDLWPTRLLKRTLPGAEAANTGIAEILLSMAAQNAQLTADYLANDVLHREHPALQWLSQCVNQSVVEYLQHAGVRHEVQWQLQSWANVNRRGDYHGLHNHPHSYLSGTYYVQVPAQTPDAGQRRDIDPGSISFFDPRPQANMQAIAGDGEIDPELRLLPSAGTLLLWPAWLHHMVHPNAADSPRLSISFNVVLKRDGRHLPRH